MSDTPQNANGHFGPEWFWDQSRPEAIRARAQMEEFHRRLRTGQLTGSGGPRVGIDGELYTLLCSHLLAEPNGHAGAEPWASLPVTEAMLVAGERALEGYSREMELERTRAREVFRAMICAAIRPGEVSARDD